MRIGTLSFRATPSGVGPAVGVGVAVAVGVAEGVRLGVVVGVGVEDGVRVGGRVGVHVDEGVAVGEASVEVGEGIGVPVPGTATVADSAPDEGRATAVDAQALSASTTKTAAMTRLFERTETLSPLRERLAGLVREIPRESPAVSRVLAGMQEE